MRLHIVRNGAPPLAALLLALAGCGSTESAATATKAKHLRNISFESSAIRGEKMPVEYTCAGKNISPPLQWGSVPVGTKELAIFILSLTPTKTSNQYAISVAWALAGVNPKLHRLRAGEVPRGAHVGREGHHKLGYDVCPKKGEELHYQFALYAVPPVAKIPSNFVGLEVLSALATGNAATTSSARGGFIASYKRT